MPSWTWSSLKNSGQNGTPRNLEDHQPERAQKFRAELGDQRRSRILLLNVVWRADRLASRPPILGGRPRHPEPATRATPESHSGLRSRR